MKKTWANALLGATALTALCGAPVAQAANPAAWTAPQVPFRIVGNVYYVGAAGLSAYLVTSDDGRILLDGTMPENVEMIARNIAALGFKITDVKFLLNSHAHFDHAGGLAGLKRASGAKMVASDGDRSALESGRHVGDNVFGIGRFPAMKVDRVIKDGESVNIGTTQMTAVLTPGHTRGCTTWTMQAREDAETYRIVFPCSLTVAGNLLLTNKTYPGIVDDYRNSFARVEALQADIVLPAHPEFADVMGRHQRLVKGETEAFVDRSQLKALVASAREDFEVQLKKAEAALSNK
jgi:metallo-beta-lactamase class B